MFRISLSMDVNYPPNIYIINILHTREEDIYFPTSDDM